MKTALFPFEIKEGARIIHEDGRIETIYGIEYERIGKYISTVATDDAGFLIFKTYFVNRNEKESAIKKAAEKKVNILKNLEKATLDCIENEIGLNDLASQLN